MEHSMTAIVEKVVDQPLDFTGSSLRKGEAETVHERDVRRFECSCGEMFESEQVAISHLNAENQWIEPEIVAEITEKMRDDRAVETGLKENGFILQDSRRQYYVGFELAEGGYIVVALWGQEKTRGQNEPRMKTRRVFVVTGESRQVGSLPFPYDDMDADEFQNRERHLAGDLADHLDKHGEKIATGYTPAYRTDSVEDAVVKTFKWHSVRGDPAE